MIVYFLICAPVGIGFWLLGRLYESHRSANGEPDVKHLESLTVQRDIYAALETNDRLPPVSALKEIVPVFPPDDSRWGYPSFVRCLSHPHIVHFYEARGENRAVCLHCGKMAEWKTKEWEIRNGKPVSNEEHMANNPETQQWFNAHGDCRDLQRDSQSLYSPKPARPAWTPYAPPP